MPAADAAPPPLLVTGGAGFIGSQFLRTVLDADVQGPVVVLDRMDYAGDRANVPDDPRIVLVEGDIADRALTASLLAEHRIGWVVNFAAQSHVDRSIDGPLPFYETNTLGAAALLESFRRHWVEAAPEERAVMRFLQVSTDEVFGTLAEGEAPWTEASAYAPRSPYAASKAAADHAVRAAFHTHGLPVLITHGCNTLGPRQFPEKLVPLVILNALEGKPLPVYGDGGQIRDWIHVQDHAEAVWTVLRRAAPGTSYAIAGGRETANLELVRKICAWLDRLEPRADGQPYHTLITHVQDRPGHDRRYAMDAARLRALGWAPRFTLERALEATVRWYLENRAWCARITENTYARQRLGLGAIPS